MKVQHIGYKLKGFYKIADLALKIISMTKSAKTKSKILDFWRKHNLLATIDAFGVSRSTLYRWNKLYHDEGPTGLNDKSKAPLHKRRRNWNPPIIDYMEDLRTAHPRLGAHKLYRHVAKLCLNKGYECPSVSTISRLIADNKEKMSPQIGSFSKSPRMKVIRNKRKTERRPPGWLPESPGDCLAIDNIVFIHQGMRRYIITCIDIHSRLAFAYASNSISSKTASEFIERVLEVFPAKVKHILSDNGSEFKKNFAALLEKKKIPHWKTFVRRPKMNAVCERFNRTIQEEFLFRKHHLLLEPEKCNEQMTEWLYWYNCERAHHSLGYNTPMEKLTEHFQNNKKSNMLWDHTII